jgi:hypothetical protein
MSESWRCPTCDGVFVAENYELAIPCDDCGEHPAVECRHCCAVLDTIWVEAMSVPDIPVSA